jgi:hypothetical protein
VERISMSERLELARGYLAAQRDGRVEEALAFLAPDVVLSNPMTGVISGKDAAEQFLRNRAVAPGMAGSITWREPVAEDGDVKVVGDGSPFGPIRILVCFNDADQITKVDIGLGS